MDKKVFIPITKRNDEEQMVYGYASTTDLDSQGDIVSVDAMKGALDGYLRFPTIREMHQAKAVGVTKEASVDDKGLFIGAKIVDKDAWLKVKEGVYSAFSIGGRIMKRTAEIVDEMRLTEISLVDVPANEHAVITLFKAESGGQMSLNKDLEKYMDENDVKKEEIDVKAKMVEDIFDARGVIVSACELCYTMDWFEYKGKPTEELMIAIKALKMLAVRLLTESEYEKFDSILATIKQNDGKQTKQMYDFLKVQSGGRI